MKIRICLNKLMGEKYYHLYLDDKHIGYQSEDDTLKKIIALIRMSECDIIINEEKF